MHPPKTWRLNIWRNVLLQKIPSSSEPDDAEAGQQPVDFFDDDIIDLEGSDSEDSDEEESEEDEWIIFTIIGCFLLGITIWRCWHWFWYKIV